MGRFLVWMISPSIFLKKSFFEDVSNVFMIKPIVFSDVKSLTNQTDSTHLRRFPYRFNLDLTRKQPEREKEIKLKIFAQDFAKSSTQKSFVLKIQASH